MIMIILVILILLVLLVNIDSGILPLVDGNFEAAPVTLYPGNWDYWNCNEWTCGGEVVIIRKTSTSFTHTTNANGGDQFVGIKALNAYIQQRIQLPPNTLFSITFDSSYRNCAGSVCGTTPIDVHCNVPGGAPVLASFSPTAAWATTTTAATCQTDASGKADVKFSINSVVGTADRTVYLDNIVINIPGLGNYQYHIYSDYHNIY